MGLFRHPHLVRGIVHTSEGAFHIERGIADIPDEVGEALGWTRLDEEPRSGHGLLPGPVARGAASPRPLNSPAS
jgi:hypothetical protein